MTIRVSLVWLGVGLFCLIEAGLLYWYHVADAKTGNTIVFGASIVAGAFALFSYLKAIEERRNASAERMIERWNSPDMTPYKDVMRSIRAGTVSIDPLKRTTKEHSFSAEHKELRSKMQALLGFFEEVSLAIRTKSADEERLKRYFEAVITQSYDRTKPWIEQERIVDGENGYYIEFEKIAKRWKESSIP